MQICREKERKIDNANLAQYKMRRRWMKWRPGRWRWGDDKRENKLTDSIKWFATTANSMSWSNVPIINMNKLGMCVCVCVCVCYAYELKGSMLVCKSHQSHLLKNIAVVHLSHASHIGYIISSWSTSPSPPFYLPFLRLCHFHISSSPSIAYKLFPYCFICVSSNFTM